jgi:hypothetical protein
MSRRVMGMVLGLVLAAMSASGQALVNPSFENEGTQADLAAGWSRWGDWINRETGWSPVKDGVCLLGYHHWQIEKPDNSGLYQDLTVEAGKQYTFGIYGNGDPAKDGAKDVESIELRLESKVGDAQTTVASKTYLFKDLASGTEWSALRVSGTAPNTSLRVLVIVNPAKEGPRGGAVKFDLATLSQ